MIMKKYLLFVISSLVFGMSFSFSAVGAFLPIKEIGTVSDWKALVAQDHPLWHKDSCLAMTQVNKEKVAASIELYAERELGSEDVFNDPLIQVITPNVDFPPYVRGILSDGGKTKTIFHLLLASNTENPPMHSLVSRLAQRKAIFDFLKKSNIARIQFIDETNKVVKTINFSLKGSSKSLDAALSQCKLAIE